MDKAKVLYWLEIVGEVFILIARGLTKDKAVGIVARKHSIDPEEIYKQMNQKINK
ncbi:hypothetical protein ABE049_10195 [Priestia megaterium]